MSFDPKPYLANIDDIDGQSLLADWNWLIGNHSFSVFLATAMGDLILRDDTNKFHFLDMVDGKIQKIADTEGDVWTLLSDRATRKNLLFTFVVRDLKNAGKTLSSGQCFSPDQPLILGGELDSDNLHPCALAVHSSIQGQIHKQLHNLPPGTKIQDVRFE